MTVRGHALTVRAFGATHTGRVRTGNEDSYLIGNDVFAVADGMGGHQAGEIASDAALEPLRELDIPGMTDPVEVSEALASAVRQANTLVVERAQADPALEGMGTTLTAIAVREGQLHVAHVGDSRAYLLRQNEKMSQLTTDHTLVERLIQEGRLSRDEAATHPQRNVITRAIGHESTVDVEVLPPITLQEGDQILLCSDGLSGPVNDESISHILSETPSGDAAVNGLLAQANAAGGPDNITAVLLRVGDRWKGATTEPRTDTSSTQQIATQDHANAATEEISGQVGIDTVALPSEDHKWADDVGRVGALPGTEPAVPSEKPKRGRIVAAALGVLIIVGALAGVGALVLSRSYFVGAHEGVLAIYQGLPQKVGGVSMARVVPTDITTTPVSEFPDFRRRVIENGLSAQSLADARRIVAALQAQLREDQIQDRSPPRSVGEPQTGPSQAP